jgi:hypothetical protein
VRLCLFGAMLLAPDWPQEKNEQERQLDFQKSQKRHRDVDKRDNDEWLKISEADVLWKSPRLLKPEIYASFYDVDC